MRVVADVPTWRKLLEQGGEVYVWPRRTRCCGGYRYTLEASLEPPEPRTELVAEQNGLRVFATLGLRRPELLELDLTDGNQVRAYWNGQSWIG